MKKIFALIMMVLLAQVYGCGGGGGGGSGGTPQPTAATLKLSAVGTVPAGKSIAGFDVTIELPAGVSVKTGTGGDVDTTVVLQSGLLSGSNGTMGPVSILRQPLAARRSLISPLPALQSPVSEQVSL